MGQMDTYMDYFMSTHNHRAFHDWVKHLSLESDYDQFLAR